MVSGPAAGACAIANEQIQTVIKTNLSIVFIFRIEIISHRWFRPTAVRT